MYVIMGEIIYLVLVWVVLYVLLMFNVILWLNLDVFFYL